MPSKKGNLAYRARYRRRLPHIQPPGAEFFVTFRLAGSLPYELLEDLRQRARRERLEIAKIEEDDERKLKLDEQRRREFGQWDDALDQMLGGPQWLGEQAVADIVVESLQHFAGVRYELDAFCIMPNHVHLLVRPLEEKNGEFYSLAGIVHSIKSYTANAANRILERRGRFWQREFYDRIVCDEREWERIVQYVLNNPVKAGLVREQEDWRWSFYGGRR